MAVVKFLHTPSGIVQKTLTEMEIQQWADMGDEECRQYLIKKDYVLSFLDGLTYDQVDQYIDNNITTLATAKEFLKKLSKVILMLAKSTHLQNE
jgi:hypothetical protein